MISQFKILVPLTLAIINCLCSSSYAKHSYDNSIETFLEKRIFVSEQEFQNSGLKINDLQNYEYIQIASPLTGVISAEKQKKSSIRSIY